MTESWVFLDGRIVPASAAVVSVRDRSFRWGEGVFETLRARRTAVFRLPAHLARLRASARRLDWSLPWTDAEIVAACASVLGWNGFPESRLRIHASPGDAGADPDPASARLVVDAEPFARVPDETRARGVVLHLLAGPWPAGATTGAKTASYLEHLIARRAAVAAGCFDALLRTASDEVIEAAMANLFAVVRGRVRTPPLTSGALAGITRGAMLEIAARESVAVEEIPITLAELLAAEEAFLTSTAVECLPVRAVGAVRIGGGAPGPVTLRLAAGYRALLENEIGSDTR
jgi:branched-chain amino acid aminotransferase